MALAALEPERRLLIDGSLVDASNGATFENVDSEDIRETDNLSLGGRYRLNQWATIWANLSRSTFGELTQEETEIRTLRIGFTGSI